MFQLFLLDGPRMVGRGRQSEYDRVSARRLSRAADHGMDIDQARTFLAIVAQGSFASAGEQLHLTQTAVSARIRTLEDQLDARLFVRDKSGARLTAAGERFVRYATALVRAWEDARQQVALPAGRDRSVVIGGEVSLWQPLLPDWLLWMQRHCPDVAVRVEVEIADRLIERVQEGTLDLAVVYGPSQRPNLVVELLMEEKLVMVTTDPSGRWDAPTYVHVDWGAAFNASCWAAFPELSGPGVSTSLGPLALEYLQASGGSGYFRSSAVQDLLARGGLCRVSGAPEFSHSIYAVYPSCVGNETLDRVRDGLRACLPGREPRA
jgi:DNA-binding transcriptional LysR family regulator